MNPAVEGAITFFYYDDLDEVSKFYGETMGFEKVLDVGFAQLFKVYDSVHVGLVDGSRGSMKPSEHKSVMLSFFVEDVEEWYHRLKERGMELSPPMEPDYLEMKVLIFKDPEGYTLELLQWLKKPYGQ
jgi:lactoylglutathione lyase